MAKSEYRESLSRAELEQMSTADLEKLLVEDFSSQQGGELEPDAPYQAAQVLAEREEYPSSVVDRAWERFQKDYLPIAESVSRFAEDGGVPSSDAAQGRRHSPWSRRCFRAALAVAVLVVVLLSVSVAAAANGNSFLRLLVQWTDEQVWLAPGQIDPITEDEIRIPEEAREYISIQEALEDYGFTRRVVPRWMPEGFETKNVVVADMDQSSLIFYSRYSRDEDSLVLQVDIYLDYEGRVDGDYVNFQKDEGDPIPYEAGGVTHMLATNAGRPVAVWANGPAECALSGDITMEELKQMIDSIYEK